MGKRTQIRKPIDGKCPSCQTEVSEKAENCPKCFFYFGKWVACRNCDTMLPIQAKYRSSGMVHVVNGNSTSSVGLRPCKNCGDPKPFAFSFSKFQPSFTMPDKGMFNGTEGVVAGAVGSVSNLTSKILTGFALIFIGFGIFFGWFGYTQYNDILARPEYYDRAFNLSREEITQNVIRYSIAAVVITALLASGALFLARRWWTTE